jgi:hypothetical protein
MELGSIFLILALLVVVIVFISRPLFEEKTQVNRSSISSEEHDASSLMAERDQILDAIQELDFDYALGKIPESDYPQQRKMLLDRGVETLRNLDSISEHPASGETGLSKDIDAALEAAIHARRAQSQGMDAREVASGMPAKVREVNEINSIDPDDDIEFMIANRRRGRKENAAGFCPNCGGPVQKSDQFCPKCGFNLV